MSAEKRRAIASKGGRAQGKNNNPANFANNPGRAAKAGAKGGKAKRANNKIS
ncbi:general stress protein YciG [Nitrobacter vulgaris]|uniref:stress-induced protein n=1 Tax=Nitrobacter vulgaris TaxID=29421 RepID=UPI002861D10B|nr:general stress protein YciG [Nitrobacter vulgaris]